MAEEDHAAREAMGQENAVCAKGETPDDSGYPADWELAGDDLRVCLAWTDSFSHAGILTRNQANLVGRALRILQDRLAHPREGATGAWDILRTEHVQASTVSEPGPQGGDGDAVPVARPESDGPDRPVEGEVFATPPVAASGPVSSLIDAALIAQMSVSGPQDAGLARDFVILCPPRGLTDLRLWQRRAIRTLSQSVLGLCRSLVTLSEGARRDRLVVPADSLSGDEPGRKRIRRVTAAAGEPVLPLSTGLLVPVWRLLRLVSRLRAWDEEAQVCPAGAGLGAGVLPDVDVPALAQSLGFRSVAQNAAEALLDDGTDGALWTILRELSATLARIHGDLRSWSTRGWVSTGQDALTVRIPPATDGDVDPFSAVEGLERCAVGLSRGLEGVGFDAVRLLEDSRAALGRHPFVPLRDWLVGHRVPARKADTLAREYERRCAGRGRVQAAEGESGSHGEPMVTRGQAGRGRSRTSDDDWLLSQAGLSSWNGDSLAGVFDPQECVERHKGIGGTSMRAIDRQIKAARAAIAQADLFAHEFTDPRQKA